MKNIADTPLSFELQELYLENKEWVSQLDFLQDELRFLHKLYEHLLSFISQEEGTNKLDHIEKILKKLTATRIELTAQINSHKLMIEEYLKNQDIPFSLEIIIAHTKIAKEIALLFKKDHSVKNELFHIAGPYLD